MTISAYPDVFYIRAHRDKRLSVFQSRHSKLLNKEFERLILSKIPKEYQIKHKHTGRKALFGPKSLVRCTELTFVDVRNTKKVHKLLIPLMYQPAIL